jgi:hypothetical protein
VAGGKLLRVDVDGEGWPSTHLPVEGDRTLERDESGTGI